ncbi:MAG: SdrD B-like domain-containing protein [Bacteroidota bacterium]
MLDSTQVTFASARPRKRYYAYLRLHLLALLLLTTVSLSFAQLSVTFNLEEPTCFGLPKGKITAIVSGGTAPYTYNWSTGATGPMLENVFAGTYTVTVMDNNGITEVESVILGEPDLVTATLVADECTLPFSVTAFGGGGIPPYSYFWSTGATSQTINNLAPGNYCVTVTDDNLCGTVECINLDNTPINLNLVTNNLDCPDSNDGSVTAFVSGGTPPYLYNWSNGATTQTVSNLAAGSYTVTVTDAAGCSVSATGIVNAPPPIIVNLNGTDPVCVGDMNGSIFSSVSGGTPPYSFFWNTGQTSQFLTNLSPGSYTVTVTDANGCDVVATELLQPQSTLNAGSFGTMETCPDADDGFLTVMANGGVMPFSYLWSNGATTQVVTNVTPGNYSVTVTDGLGCTATSSTVVMAAPDIVLNVDANDITTCGANNGTVFATVVSGGTPPFSYSWSTGDNTAVVTNLPAGNYTVLVTDANGCTQGGLATIVAPPDVTLSITATTVICPDSNEGSATAIPSNGTPPYTFLWSTGATSQTISNLGPGGYSVTVMDANGCMDSRSVVITESPDFTINVVGTETVCGAGNTGSATALITSGSGPFTYLWNTGATSASISNLPEGTYTVTVTNSDGCTETDNITIDIIDDFAVAVSKTNVDCFGDNTGTAMANPTGGTPPYSYLWNTGATTPTISNLPSGPYSVTVTDQNGCTASGAVIVTTPPMLSVTINGSESVCEGENTGVATAIPSGGTPGYTYLWNTGATSQTITGLVAGTYTVTVMDINNCTAVSSIQIVESPGLTAEINANTILCGMGETGSASVTVMGGTAPFSFMWSTGSTAESIDNLPAGTYTVEVTDANGCSDTAEITINMVNDLSVSVTIRNILCLGDSNGGALAEANGGMPPYSFTWNTGSNSDELIDIPAGTYTVMVTDANGCTAEASGTVISPTELTVGATSTDADCFGESSGTATASPMGGTPPYTYAWSTGGTTPMIMGLAEGIYEVTVTDANLCTAEANVEIGQPDDLSINVNAPIIECGGTNSGSASAIVTGGTGPYTYAWSNGGMTQTIDGLPAGIYEITVTDANGCTVEGQAFTLSELPQLALDFEVSNIICTDQNVGEVSVSVTGGTAPFAYQWNNGATTETISGLQAGTYMVTVTDANNCEATGMATVTQSLGLMVTATGTDVTCNGFNDGTATANVSGGVAPLSYEWSNSETTQMISGLAPGTYMVTVTDNDGCTGEASVTISQPATLGVMLSGMDLDCSGDNNGMVTSTVSGGTMPYTYAWSNGMMTANIGGLSGGTYEVTVTDANGCGATASITLDEPDPIQAIAIELMGTCDGSMDGSARVTASGGTPPYTYEWTNGDTDATIAGLAPGTYTVTVTDANECTATAMVTVTGFDTPTCVVNIITPSMMGNDGSLEAVVTGGTAPYTYAWSNGNTTSLIAGLAPGTYTATVTDANGCETVCENTLEALAGIGNYVWEDTDRDGLQDDNEPPVSGVTVNLKDENGMIIATTTTDDDGMYLFLGLTPATYSVQFELPDGFDFTFEDNGDDALDNDAIASMNGMTINTTLDPGEIDLTWDAGIYVPPTSDLTDPCNCLNNATNESNGQFGELLTVFSYPGETWTLIEAENMFDINSPEPPAAPIPISLPFVLQETSPGEYQLPFRIIDEMTYNAAVITNGFDTLDINNTCTYPSVGLDQIPDGDVCVFDDPFPIEAAPSIPGTLVFTLDGVPITEFDPEEAGIGIYEFVAELVPFDPDECTARIVTTVNVIGDCTAKVGDFVWLDQDRDGTQDPGEPGIEGVKVIINGQEEDDDIYADTTMTDANGLYCFFVPPGTYKVTFMNHDDLLSLTDPNQGGDDALDSDADPLMGMTDVFSVTDGDTLLTIDAGYVTKCDNATDPGEIGFYQFLCGPGVDPEPLVEVEAPSGGSGELEFLWMFSTVPGPFDPNIWTMIPNSNTPNYDPGPLYETTFFARCVRRECCVTYLESNIITIEVGSVAEAVINGPSIVCEDTPTTFFAAGVGPDAVVEWDFGPGASPQMAMGSNVDVTWSSFGNFEIHLSVTENGCTSTDVRSVTVTNSPVQCGNGLVIDVNVLNQAVIMVDWRVPEQQQQVGFSVEHSPDGENFTTIGQMLAPTITGDGQDYYEFIHEDPKMGRNYYRVKMEDSFGTTAYSDIGEGIIYGDSRIAMLFPNPVEDQLRLELFETFDDEVTINVIGIQGIIYETLRLPADTKQLDVDFSNYAAGTYFLRLSLGKVDVKTMKVVKQ